MIVNFFKQLANGTGLPQLSVICGLVIIVSLTLFGIFILIKVRSIKKVLNNLNGRLDLIGQQLGWQSGQVENVTPDKYHLTSPINYETAADSPGSLEADNSADIEKEIGSEAQRINTEIGVKILELLETSGKPAPYHELTKHLSKVYPGYNYDFLLKEVENLQKKGKVEVQLVGGKLYFLAKKK